MTIENDLVGTGMWDSQASILGTAVKGSNLLTQMSTAQVANLTTQAITALTTADYAALSTAQVAALNAAHLSLNTLVTAVKSLTKAT